MPTMVMVARPPEPVAPPLAVPVWLARLTDPAAPLVMADPLPIAVGAVICTVPSGWLPSAEPVPDPA